MEQLKKILKSNERKYDEKNIKKNIKESSLMK